MSVSIDHLKALCIFYYFTVRLDGKESKVAMSKAAILEKQLEEHNTDVARRIYEQYDGYLTNFNEQDTFLGYKFFLDNAVNASLRKGVLLTKPL